MTPRTRVRMTPWEGAPDPPREWQAGALEATIAAFRTSRPNARVYPLVSAVMGAGKSRLIAELAFLAYHARAAVEDVVLIAAPRQNLVRQLGATVRQRVGKEHVGLYFQHEKQPRRPVIVCCYQSLPGLIDELITLGRRVCLFVGDEAHRTQCRTVLDAWEHLQPLSAVGVTATPYRADEGEKLTIWTDIVFTYSLAQALADGVLVDFHPIKPLAAWQADVEHLDQMAALDEVCIRLLDHAVAQGLACFPMISSAYDCGDADAFAEVLRSRGYTADVVHSKRSQEDNELALKRLEAGETQVVVQVNMLSEGADFPWLRGLLLRRDIGSPVMAFQFLGRVLRACPSIGKRYAVVLDPTGNLDRHGVSHPAQLGEAMEQAKREGLDAEPDEDESGGGEAVQRTIRLAFVGEVEAWTSSVLLAMDVAGIYQRQSYEGRDGWREEGGPSAKQLELCQSMAWVVSMLPEEVRKPFRTLLAAAPDLPRGAVSDLLSILFALSAASRETRERAKVYVEEHGTHRNKPRWVWPESVTLAPCPPPSADIAARLKAEAKAKRAEAKAAAGAAA